MQEQVNSIQTDVKEIKDAILGTKLNPNGIIKRVKNVENYQNKDKKQKWIVAGVFLTLGTLSKFGKEIVNYFNH